LRDWIAQGFPTVGVPAPPPAPPVHTNPLPSYPAYGGTVLQKGSKGTQVRLLQQRLKDRGWKISVDGDFGSGTESIVKSFQKDKGLTVDGKVGPNTWKTLWTSAVT
jgi:peptidoglycan hydrolase-like protein with peptidoglycan-binding domain